MPMELTTLYSSIASRLARKPGKPGNLGSLQKSNVRKTYFKKLTIHETGFFWNAVSAINEKTTEQKF